MTWQAEKYQLVRRIKRVVVKVGSAVLTTPEGLDKPVVDGMVAQLAALNKAGCQVVLVSSGAVAAGRVALGSGHELASLAARQAAAAVGQSRLMHYYDEAFAIHGVLSAQVLLTRDDLRSRSRFLNARNTFAELLAWGAIPIVNENDTVSTEELRFGDNDCLASLLVNLVEAELFINLTSAAGVLADNPQLNPQAGIMSHIADVGSLNLDKLCGGKTSVGTGGMYSKLIAARRAAQLGVPTYIVPGKTPNIIEQVRAGAEVGTWVCPAKQTISRRKFWMAYQSDPTGTLRVDAGAVKALQEKGSSLLPGGVFEVEGNFKEGALVRIVTQDQQVLGVGLSNYSAPVLRKIMGLKRHEVAAQLGDAHYPEVIHRDNLLLNAAI